MFIKVHLYTLYIFSFGLKRNILTKYLKEGTLYFLKEMAYTINGTYIVFKFNFPLTAKIILTSDKY